MIRVNHGDTLLTVQCHSDKKKKSTLRCHLFVLFEDDTMLERTAAVSVYNKKCGVRPSGLKKRRKPKNIEGKIAVWMLKS